METWTVFTWMNTNGLDLTTHGTHAVVSFGSNQCIWGAIPCAGLALYFGRTDLPGMVNDKPVFGTRTKAGA